MSNTKTENPNLEKATLGGGCFWCLEAVFQRIEGVEMVESGYMGGKISNPTYKEICTGKTGHAEVVQITFDTKKISYETLLDVFFGTHDPTTLNRQGNDVGTQYRSIIFYHDDIQKKLAYEKKEQLEKLGIFKDPIVTEITYSTVFYKAEDYHQNYFNLNGYQPYCQFVVRPKVEKLKKNFSELLAK
ncbi:MAG: peptide-methionine (S)-S-oxide reductase MsrA [Cytophagales bacterium]